MLFSLESQELIRQQNVVYNSAVAAGYEGTQEKFGQDLVKAIETKAEDVTLAVDEYMEEHKDEFKGEPGHTPQKGVDYFTEDEVEELVEIVSREAVGDKLDATNPTGTGSFSMNRKSDTTTGQYSTALGLNCEASGDYSHAEGYFCIASGSSSHAEGQSCTASGYSSHAEGDLTKATGSTSHAEGYQTQATAEYTHAEGEYSKATQYRSHAEGYMTTASGTESHAEGSNTTASGSSSHAEGQGSKATGSSSHAEGNYTEASGFATHAEGNRTIASAGYSHAEGYYTTASGQYQHVEGKYNVEDTENKFAHIVGGGAYKNPKNINTLDWEGNSEFAGDVKANACGGDSPISLVEVSNVASNAIPSSAKGIANGVAELDENGKVPVEQLPEIGGGVSTWDGITNKPFESIGSGLSVVDGVLSATGGGGGGSIPTKKSYTSIIMNVAALNGSNTIMLSEIKLYNDGVEVNYPNGTTCTASNSPSTSSEGAENLIDGNLATKYNASFNNRCDITINFSEPIEFDSYSYVTANDANQWTGRNPDTWQLLGASDGNSYEILSTVFNASIPNESNIETPIYRIYSYGSGGSSESNGNIYSTIETIVGTWIDGKDIYRIVTNEKMDFYTKLGSTELLVNMDNWTGHCTGCFTKGDNYFELLAKDIGTSNFAIFTQPISTEKDILELKRTLISGSQLNKLQYYIGTNSGQNDIETITIDPTTYLMNECADIINLKKYKDSNISEIYLTVMMNVVANDNNKYRYTSVSSYNKAINEKYSCILKENELIGGMYCSEYTRVDSPGKKNKSSYMALIPPTDVIQGEVTINEPENTGGNK